MRVHALPSHRSTNAQMPDACKVKHTSLKKGSDCAQAGKCMCINSHRMRKRPDHAHEGEGAAEAFLGLPPVSRASAAAPQLPGQQLYRRLPHQINQHPPQHLLRPLLPWRVLVQPCCLLQHRLCELHHLLLVMSILPRANSNAKSILWMAILFQLDSCNI